MELGSNARHRNHVPWIAYGPRVEPVAIIAYAILHLVTCPV